MKSVCVYMGARDGNSPHWRELATHTGRCIAERGWRLVYGGGGTGLMGACADGALAAGGEVIGVIPDALVELEAGHRGLTELIQVPDMHVRKATMSQLADGFIALPGGIGTFEELFESWTWAYLGIHHKPVGLLNAEGFFDTLLAFLDQTCAHGFMRPDTRASLLCEDDIETLLARMFAGAA